MQHVSCVGLKRKLALDEVGGVESEPKMAAVSGEWLWRSCVQRQVLLQLSMQKLCHFAPHAETALARRVLIANTLRLLRDDHSQQGAETGRRPEPGQGVEPEQGAEPLPPAEGSLTPAWVLEQDGEAFLSRPSGLDPSPDSTGTPPQSSLASKDSFSWALAEIEDLFSAVSSMGDGASSACPFGASSSVSSSFSQADPQIPLDTGSGNGFPANEMSEKETQIHTSAIGPTICDPHLDSSHHTHFYSPAPFLDNPTPLSIISFPSSLSVHPDLSLDNLPFSDLDLLCEFNSYSSNLSPTPSSSPKVSMVTDDIMEHIMEVLVGS